jgi:hydroxyacylglutathione hydrolase
MKIEQIYTGCLAVAAYYIESNGEVAIIDPLREVQPYLEKAKKDNASIKYVLETHFHADFVSGHLDLAKKTGATIVYGPNAQPDFDAHIAHDNEVLKLGDITITVLHTPGHTMESTCYLLKDEHNKDVCIFTGDTLFIGDVGRPDLAVKTHLTREDLAAHLYDSLYHKIMPLDDDIMVYPGHGAGSACGKNMGKETFSTLGHQKKYNYALQNLSKDEFVQQVTAGLTPPPQYFPKNVLLNKQGYESINAVFKKGLNALIPEEFEQVANENNALIIDTRDKISFVNEFIPNSIFIGLDGSFASWVGALVTDLEQPILLVCDEGKAEEAITRLARVGYDNTLGYLAGAMESWKKANKEIDSISSISADALEQKISNEDIQLIDARKPSEYEAEHVNFAINKPLDYINEWMGSLDKKETYYIHCASGYRSVIMASILKARGFQNIIDIDGGFKAIAETNIPKTKFVCPSTLK